MRVILAGATGAIGLPLIRRLKEAGHLVFGLARSEESARALTEAGAGAVTADALDARSVRAAIARIRPDAVINELTSLPRHYTPAEMKAAAARDVKVRIEGNANLLAALKDAGVGRYILQSAGFWYAPGAGLADESEPLAVDASPGVSAGARTGIGGDADCGGRIRPAPLWILLRTGHLVHQRWRRWRSCAPAATPNHRCRRGRIELGEYR
jgi:nucleoside-diphosphate-sugar epimerase